MLESEIKLEDVTDNTANLEGKRFLLSTIQNQKHIDKLDKKALDSIKIITPSILAAAFKSDIKVVGITGTNGKTTTCAIIYSLLLDLGFKVALLGTRGFFINDKQVKQKGLTTPMLLEIYKDLELASKQGCEYFIMEVSSHALDLGRVQDLKFYSKILTNITSDHLDYHKSQEEYARVKLSFFKNSNEAIKIINLDDKYASSLKFFPNTFSYGLESNAYLKVVAYGLKEGITAEIGFLDSKNRELFSINSELFGLFNLYNIIAALCFLKIDLKHIDFKEVCFLLPNFSGVKGRMEVIKTKPLVIIDFAHTQDGMQKVFESLKGSKISCVFGAGGNRDKGKRALMGQVANLFANKIYLTHDNPRYENPDEILQDILEGINKERLDKARVIKDRRSAIFEALKNQEEDEIVLILGKGDEEYQEIMGQKHHFSDKECVLEYFNANN